MWSSRLDVSVVLTLLSFIIVSMILINDSRRMSIFFIDANLRVEQLGVPVEPVRMKRRRGYQCEKSKWPGQVSNYPECLGRGCGVNVINKPFLCLSALTVRITWLCIFSTTDVFSSSLQICAPCTIHILVYMSIIYKFQAISHTYNATSTTYEKD